MLLPLFGMIALGLAWSCYWWIALGYAKEEFAKRREDLKANGYQLVCDSESWGGYPFRFEFACNRPVATLPRQMELRSAMLQAVALAYKPWHIIVLLDGPTDFAERNRQPSHIQHGRIAVSIQLNDSSTPTVSAEVSNVAIPGDLSLATLFFHIRPRPDDATDVAISANGWHWRTATGEYLDIDTGKLRGALTRNQDLLVDSVELQRDQVRYWGKGQIGLDQFHRLQGKLATQTNDLEGLLKIITPHLLMTNAQKANLRIVLGLIAQNAGADLIARNGELYIGPFKIADLLPLY